MTNANIKNMRFNDEYRPSKFSEVVGQRKAIKTLRGSIRDNKVQNGYLFTGVTGGGKTTSARIFTNALICENIDENQEPCGECKACKGYKSNPELVGVIEMDAGSSGSVNNIRELKEKLKYTHKYKYTVIVIDEVHLLSKDGASALLKILEEPPEGTVFILITTEGDKILDTIKNRCVNLVFNKVSVKDIVKRLKKIAIENNIKSERGVLTNIALASKGSVRTAVGLLQQMSIMVGNNEIKMEDLEGIIRIEDKYVKNTLKLILNKDIVGIMQYIESQEDFISKEDFDYFMARLRRYLMQEDISVDYSRVIMDMLDVFMEYKNKLSYNVAPKTLIESSSIRCVKVVDKYPEEAKWLIDKFDIQDEDAFVGIEDVADEDNSSDSNIEDRELNKSELYKNNESDVKLLVKDKSDIFISLMENRYSDFKHKFKDCIANVDEYNILNFSVSTPDKKEELKKFLMREYAQSLKPICDIKGFLIKVGI